MLSPLEDKILHYLFEHNVDGKLIELNFSDENLINVIESVKSLAKKGYVVSGCTLISAAARLTPAGKYYIESSNKNSTSEKFIIFG